MEKIIDKENIYEFDLEQFFPSVEGSYITECLLKAGCPEEIARWVQDMHKSRPELPEERKLEETALQEKEDLDKALKEGKIIGDHPALKEWRNMVGENGGELEDMLLSEMFSAEEIAKNKQQCILKYCWEQWGILEEVTQKPQKFYNHFAGVPQGAPTSPLMAIVALGDTVMRPDKGSTTVMYADDGVKASNDPDWVRGGRQGERSQWVQAVCRNGNNSTPREIRMDKEGWDLEETIEVPGVNI